MHTTVERGETAPGAGSEGGTPPSVVVDSVLAALMTVGRLMRQRVGGDRLDPGTFWLLKTIGDQGPLRVTELAGCASLDPSTVSRHVAQLDRAGLVRRSPDPADGRAHRVELSPEGAERLQRSLERRRALLTHALDAWEPDDVTHLDQLLGRFVREIEKLDPERETA